MIATDAVTAIETVAKLAEQHPDLLTDLEAIYTALRAGKDPTPAVKAAQVSAAEKFLGI